MTVEKVEITEEGCKKALIRAIKECKKSLKIKRVYTMYDLKYLKAKYEKALSYTDKREEYIKKGPQSYDECVDEFNENVKKKNSKKGKKLLAIYHIIEILKANNLTQTTCFNFSDKEIDITIKYLFATYIKK